ncbi:MAG: LysR family transcriptional regulator [Arenicella sp.]
MLPSLKALQAFEAVARNNSFTLAADELNVTQSAVSHQVKHLEQVLRTTLLVRQGRSFTLSPSGKILLQHLSEAIALMKRGVAESHLAKLSIPLGVSLRSHFASKWLAPRLGSLWRDHVGFDIRFHHSNLPASVNNPGIHLSIEWLHDSEVTSEHIKLVEGNLTPACHPTVIDAFQLAEPQDLRGCTLLHESNEESWVEWMELAGIGGLDVNRNEYYDDTNVRQQAALEGEGVVLVCPELAKDDIEAGRLVCPFKLSLSTYSYYLVLLANPDELSNVGIFRDWILNQ